MEPLWYDSLQELAKLMMRVYNDHSILPAKVDGIYLFGQNIFFEDPIIDAGAQLWREGHALNVFVCIGGVYGDEQIPYSGFKTWRSKLIERGVSLNAIYPVPSPRLSHTHTEAELLVSLAKEYEWKNLIISAYTTHALRSFLNTLTFTILEHHRICRSLRVWVKPSAPLQWDESTQWSQWKAERVTRIDSFDNELERIQRYWAKGDLPSAAQALDYLVWRDSESKESYSYPFSR